MYNTSSFYPFEGLRIIVHDPMELPSYSGYQIYCKRRENYHVIIDPELNLMDDSVKTLSLEKRGCYLPGEKSLKYFKVYTKKNCEHECLSLGFQLKCGCVPFYMISKNIYFKN